MQRVPGFYFNYFSKLLAAPGGELSADISPSYAGLGHDRLCKIKDEFRRRGIDCLPVFLMRDPVQRCASLVGMWKKRLAHGQRPPDAAFLDLNTYCRTEHARMLTDYRHTLAQIERSFEPARSYLGLYEEMFTDESIAALSAFLGVESYPSEREKRVNVSSDAPALTDADFVALAPLFRSAYEAAAMRLPQAVELWKGFKYLS